MKSVAITTTYKAIADLDTGAARMNIVQPLATYDDSAHVFAVEIRRGSSAEELSGTTCIGYFVRADGVTIPIDGDVKGNVATVILAANCYAVAGGFALAVKLSMGNVVHTVLRATGNVSVSQTDEMASPGTGLQSFDKLVEAAEKAEGYDARITETEKTLDTLVEQTQKIPLSIQVNLSSTQPAAVDGTDNLKPGRTGVLSIDGGGTGATSKEAARINIGAASTEEVRQRDRVQNLLDNSDFSAARFIAQAGVDKYHGSVQYVGDRWIGHALIAATGQTNGLHLRSVTQYAYIHQKVNVKAGKRYTLAVHATSRTGMHRIATYNSDNSVIYTQDSAADRDTLITTFTAGEDVVSILYYPAFTESGGSAQIEWAALYEGEYTANTLPAYQPKERVVELYNCDVPLQPRNELDNSDFTLGRLINQRGETSTTSDSVYIVDRWIANSSNNRGGVSVGSGGITLTPVGDDYSGIYQRMEHYTQNKGKTYTVAVCVNGVWECKTFALGGLPGGHLFGNGLMLFSVDNMDVLFRAYSAYASAVTIQRVALYAGEYTAETLPAYVERGFAEELAECMRYYQRSNAGLFVGIGSFGANYAGVSFYVPMRIAPTVVTTSLNGFDVSVVGVYNDGFLVLNENVNNAQIRWEASAEL